MRKVEKKNQMSQISAGSISLDSTFNPFQVRYTTGIIV
jgi:hypothetical protein